MSYCLIPMSQAELDAFADDLIKIVLHGMRNVFAQHIAAKRERQICFALPPFAKIGQFLKTGASVSKLAFVNDQTGVGAPVFYGLENLIKRHDDVPRSEERRVGKGCRW